MRRVIPGCIFFLLATQAQAAVPCTLPFQLQNNTVADATQVMANYNAIITCLQGAAAAGVNNDITSLQALTTPIAPGLGGTQTFTGGTSTSSANAQVITPTVPANFSASPGYKIVFQAGFTNTGPTTLQVASSAATAVFRRTTDGPQALQGGEIVLGSIVEAVFDGVRYQLMSNISPFPVGTVLDTIAANPDVGFLLLDGSCKSTTTFNALFMKMGSTVGSCTAGNFQLPDGRGKVIAMLDYGAGNITVAGSACAATGTGNLYNLCGSQNTTLAQQNLPNVDLQAQSGNGVSATTSMSPSTGYANSAVAANIFGTTGSGSFQSPTFTTTINGHIYLNNNVTQTPVFNLPPTLLLNKQVKY